jgi:hypothetical protein
VIALYLIRPKPLIGERTTGTNPTLSAILLRSRLILRELRRVAPGEGAEALAQAAHPLRQNQLLESTIYGQLRQGRTCFVPDTVILRWAFPHVR